MTEEQSPTPDQSGDDSWVYSPAGAWAARPYPTDEHDAVTENIGVEARHHDAQPIPDPTGYTLATPVVTPRRRVSAAGVIGTTLLSVLILLVVGFGCYVLGTTAGQADGYKRGYAEGSSTVAHSADNAAQQLRSLSSASSSVSSSLAAMLPLVNPCSEEYGQREATQTTWGQYGWGCKYTTKAGHKFSVLIGEADRAHVGKPQVEKRRNGQTKGCIATGSPTSNPAFGLTVWVAEDEDLNACGLAESKWKEVADESSR